MCTTEMLSYYPPASDQVLSAAFLEIHNEVCTYLPQISNTSPVHVSEEVLGGYFVRIIGVVHRLALSQASADWENDHAVAEMAQLAFSDWEDLWKGNMKSHFIWR